MAFENMKFVAGNGAFELSEEEKQSILEARTAKKQKQVEDDRADRNAGIAAAVVEAQKAESRRVLKAAGKAALGAAAAAAIATFYVTVVKESLK